MIKGAIKSGLIIFLTAMHTVAVPVAKIVLQDQFQTDEFAVGTKLFLDRPFVLAECPDLLAGEFFVRGWIESIRFEVVRDGELTVLTPDSNTYRSSQAVALESKGFVRVMTPETFQLFGEQFGNRVRIYRKDVKSGEQYDFNKWTVVFAEASKGVFASVPESAPGSVMDWGGVAGIVPQEKFQEDEFVVGTKLFLDRPFVLAECPGFLAGKSFVRGSIDSIRFRVVRDGVLGVLTPDSNTYRSSQAGLLGKAGFVRVMTPETFQLFGEKSGDRVRIYRKEAKSREQYEFGKWAVVLAFAQEGASPVWDDSEPIQGVPPRWDQNAGEVLYNGIQLPREWPPMNISSTSWDPMPVPYLDYPPEVIPIDVGRQLFFDDFLIETTDLSRTFHYPVKYSGNPVLKAETPLEKGPGNMQAGACPKSGGLWWDPDKQVFELWYEAGWLGKVCYATSSNGLEWNRPDLDVVPGSNQVLPPGLQADSGTVVRDWWTEDPAEKYKIFAREPASGKSANCFVSPDGIHWGDPVQTGVLGDRSTMFFNPFRKKWIISVRSWFKDGRARHYWEGDDLMAVDEWDGIWNAGQQPVVWASVDNLDTPDPVIKRTPQLYNLDAVAYESIMLGFFQIWRGPDNEECGGNPKITELNFAYSRDGFHWERPDRTTAIKAERVAGVWDRGYVQSLGNICVLQGDEIWFYYAGYAGDETRPKDGMYGNGAMGVAVLRRDGFASMDTSGEGTLLTRPVTFEGKYLFVNAAVSDGTIRAEVLDENNVPIEPFTLANSIAYSGDSTLQRISWSKGNDLSVLSGRPVRLRFVLENGELYSFWVSQDENGRSDGFVAGGGPGYFGPTDTVGVEALEANEKSLL